jgi:hypothetical protein
VELEDELLAEELQAELAADYDPVAEGLGLTPDEDFVRLDPFAAQGRDSTPPG